MDPSSNKSESNIAEPSKTSADVEVESTKKAMQLDESGTPPDGGFRAWLIVVASFVTNGLVFGMHNNISIFYWRLKNEMEQSGIADAATKASFMGSLSLGITFFVSPLAAILIDSIGLRWTAFLGGAIASVGMLASSFALDHVEALYFTYGVLFGAGASLAYNASLIILGHYFQRRLGVVNGIVAAGSSVFTVALNSFLEAVLNKIGLAATFQVLAGMMALLMICALSYIPVLQVSNDESSEEENSVEFKHHSWRKYVSFSVWKNKKFVIWAIAVPFSMLGYFVPLVHLVAYTKDIQPDANGNILIQCIGIASGVGRLLFGKIGDLNRVNRVILQQSAFFAYGVCTMLLAVAGYVAAPFPFLISLCLFMGLFDGCFVSLVGPIAFDLCGPQRAGQAIGFLLGLYTLPIISGPTVAGAVYQAFGSYEIPFLLAGGPPIICAFIMLFILRVQVLEANLRNARIIEPEDDKKNIKRLVRKASVLFVTNIQPDPEKYDQFDESHLPSTRRKQPVLFPSISCTNGGLYPAHSFTVSGRRSQSNPASLTNLSASRRQSFM